MNNIIQRVLRANVKVNGKIVSEIDGGLLVYIGVGKEDTSKDAEFIADKLVRLRIFQDETGRMNRSVFDVGGEILVVPNFTLQGDCRRGRRPSFDAAAEPQKAQRLYKHVVTAIEKQGIKVKKGIFGAHMQISSVNDGPVTFVLESR